MKVYLDGAANTPLDKDVFKAMKKVMPGYFGNSFSTHSFGIKSMQIMEESRNKVAKALGTDIDNVYFTSGATEANNWVLKSLYLKELEQRKNPKHVKRNRIIISAIEHSSIIHCCKDLELLGAEIVYLKPNHLGRIVSTDLINIITEDVLVVAVMAVNNEIGTKNDIPRLAKIAHKNGSYFLSDCTQFLSYGEKYVKIGKIFKDADYLTFSGHKIYGPTGIGCLIVQNNAPIYSFISGGAQEQGKRGGTSNLAGIVGIGEALEKLSKRKDYEHYEKLYNYLSLKCKENPEVHINFKPDHKNIVNVSLSLSDNQRKAIYSLAQEFDWHGIACSESSACDAVPTEDGEKIPSHVLVACGLTREQINSSVRLSFTRFTSTKDIDYFFEVVKKIMKIM